MTVFIAVADALEQREQRCKMEALQVHKDGTSIYLFQSHCCNNSSLVRFMKTRRYILKLEELKEDTQTILWLKQKCQQL